MRNVKKTIIEVAFVLLAIAAVLLFYVTKVTKDKDYIDLTIEKYKPTGASVAIIENGRIKEVRNYGFADKENKIKVGDNTKFKIASISKVVTSYAVMKLVDEGKLDLDKPVNTYLKKWKVPQSSFDENKVTLRTLMSHTSGLTGSDEYGYKEPLPTIDQALKQRDIKLKREPGTVFEYSEFAGLGICQLVIEDVTGEKFEDYMADHVFNKIHMDNTDYSNGNSKGTFAVPYAGFNKPAPVTPIVMNGGGGIATTSKDFALFDIELMNYFNKGSREMFTAQKNTKSAGGVYGLGIIPRKLKNGKIVYEHNGTLTGWNAQMVMEQESRNGIVVVSNSDKAFFMTYNLMEKWGDNVLGERVIDTEIAHLCKTVDIAVIIGAVIVLIALSSLIFRIKKGRIHRLDDRKRRKRYVISSVVLLISAALYTLFLYTDIPFRVLLNMDNYFIFTFLPSVYMWVNVMLAVLAVCIIIRSGYTKKGKYDSILMGV